MCFAGTKMNCWRSVSTVEYLAATSTCRGEAWASGCKWVPAAHEQWQWWAQMRAGVGQLGIKARSLNARRLHAMMQSLLPRAPTHLDGVLQARALQLGHLAGHGGGEELRAAILRASVCARANAAW